MGPDRVERHVQLGGDLSLREAARQEAQHLDLALGELPVRRTCRAPILCRPEPKPLLGPLESADPVTWVGQRFEQVACSRQEAPSRSRLVLSLPDLGKGETRV